MRELLLIKFNILFLRLHGKTAGTRWTAAVITFAFDDIIANTAYNAPVPFRERSRP